MPTRGTRTPSTSSKQTKPEPSLSSVSPATGGRHATAPLPPGRLHPRTPKAGSSTRLTCTNCGLCTDVLVMTSPRRTHPPRLPQLWRPGVSAALPVTTRRRTTSSTSSSVPRTRLAFFVTGGSSMSANVAPTITPTWPFRRTRSRRSSSASSA
eukprot:6185514-Pleurochrysis_carterae.AAC.1